MKAVLVVLLSMVAAVPAFAGAPANGTWTSTDIGGVMLPGRYSESWLPAKLGNNNTLNEKSWDGSTLGGQWWWYCPWITGAPTLLFNNVADFGNHPQPVVAMWGKFRWFIPGVDVRAGTTVKAPAFGISGDGIELFGAFRPVWRADGSRVSYRSGVCTISSVSVNPTPGEQTYDPIFGGKNPLGTCSWDWGPTQSTANQVLYTENSSGGSNVFRITEGGTHPGEKLTQYSDVDYQLLFDLHWLPDGSGFLFSNQTLMRDSANIFRYDFKTRKVTQITRLENEFTGTFSISADGRAIVFERSKSLEDNREIDLWIVNLDGRDAHLLVRNGFAPSWR